MGQNRYLAFEQNTAAIGGVTRTWAEWCDIKGLRRSVVYQRMWHGDTFEEAVSRSFGARWSWWKNTTVTIGGVTKTPEEWARAAGLKKSTAYMRIYRYGMSAEKALTLPPEKGVPMAKRRKANGGER
jgi:hypothetical protein